MNGTEQRIQQTATEVHQKLKRYFSVWQDLEKMANQIGKTICTKTAELKDK